MTDATPIQVGTLPANSPEARLDWSIARLLREQYPDVRLRAQVRNHGLLEQVTLGSLLEDPLRLDAFLEECRSIPQCGSAQVTRLREVLATALRTAQSTGQCVFRRPRSEAMPSAASDKAASVEPRPTEWRFLPDFVDAAEDVFFRMWRLAQFDPLVYLPTTLPEFAKTPEVLAVELAPGRDLTAYLQRLAGLRRAFDNVSQIEGLILLDAQALKAVFARRGRYAVLSREAIEQQAGTLRQAMAKWRPGVTCMVCDFEVSGLSSGAFVGSKGVLYAMGGYVVFDDPQLVALLQRRLATARAQGRPLAQFLDEMC